MQNGTAEETPPSGLRERKKQRTRRAIIEAAMQLYQERGFEGVTIAEIARLADVSPRTFFSYFESKDDVFLGRGDERLELLVEAIRERDHRQPILVALRRALQGELPAARQPRPPGMPDLPELLRHPAIANRLRERWNRWEDVLAEAIAADVGAAASDPEPRVVAAALTGAIRVAAAAAWEQPGRRQQIAERVFDFLAGGFSSYGAKPASRRGGI